MNSRDQILEAVKRNQPEELPLPNLQPFYELEHEDIETEFIRVLEGIGSRVVKVKDTAEAIEKLKEEFKLGEIRVVSPMEALREIAEPLKDEDPHQLANVGLMVLPAHFAVAENGACWVNDELYGERVLPFIPQHLALIVDGKNILATMHEAYQRIGGAEYGFGTFISGPSKTADIEQSLVLGAHGPRSLRVFLVDEEPV